MYFIFAYVETAFTECLALSNTIPVALTGLNRPASASTPPAVAGAIFYNAFDTTNDNSFVWDAKKICLITNADATDAVDVTFKTPDSTQNGLAVVTADLVVRVLANSLAIVPGLPTVFRDGTVVKVEIAEVGGTAITDCKIAVVKTP